MRPSVQVHGNVIRLVPRTHARSVERGPHLDRAGVALTWLALAALLAALLSCSPNERAGNGAPASPSPLPPPAVTHRPSPRASDGEAVSLPWRAP